MLLRRRNRKAHMIDIFCSGGAMCSIQMSFDTMERIMRDDFIKDDDFVPITFYDGVRGAVRKRYINFFCEHAEVE